MTNTLSFMTANYVARQVNYQMTDGWMQGETASQAHFKAPSTFADRFETYLQDIQAMGFEAIDLWLGILHPQWAKEAHLDAAYHLLKTYQLPAMSLAGWFGKTPDEFDMTCEFAAELGIEVLAGMTAVLHTDRAFVVETLRKYGLKLALENHAERTPQELLKQLGKRDEDVLGVALDTGWWGTQGYDAVAAIEALKDRLFAVHLKDVLAVGAHDTCVYGQGVVPIQACVAALQRIGYGGALSVEHVPATEDPAPVCIDNLNLLKGWLIT